MVFTLKPPGWLMTPTQADINYFQRSVVVDPMLDLAIPGFKDLPLDLPEKPLRRVSTLRS
jgi:hypothetical protein